MSDGLHEVNLPVSIFSTVVTRVLLAGRNDGIHSRVMPLTGHESFSCVTTTRLRQQGQFLWAGLGRIAGGAVVSGPDLVVQVGETFLTKTVVQIGKAIFHDLAWLREAFLDDAQNAINLAPK
jgi:hypothetical protein